MKDKISKLSFVALLLAVTAAMFYAPTANDSEICAGSGEQNYFKKLTVQVGYANGIYHCWCKDDKGIIIDPTRKQFDGEIKYTLIAERFLEKDEIELSTGAIFLNT